MKILALIIPALVNIAVGVVMFFMLLLGLNGFSGKQAEPGLILFIVWIILTVLATGVLSFVATGWLINHKSWSPVLSALVSSVVFIAVGVVSCIVGFFASAFLVSALR